MSAASASPSTSARLLAVSLLVAVVAVSSVGLVLVLVNRSVPVPLEWGARWTPGLWAVVFAAVGAMIATRVSGNAIGWLLLVAGGLSGSMFLVGEVAIDIGARGGVPGAALFWYTTWSWIPTVVLVIIALILFPTGRPRSRFWRRSIGVIATFGLIYAFLVATGPEIQPYAAAPISNPLAVDLFGVAAGGTGVYALFQASLLLGPLALMARRRRADESMRHQLRWVAFAAAILVTTMLVVEIPNGLGYLTAHYHTGTVAIAVFVSTVPVAMGIAVLRYRLYDIDQIISRTLGYGLVTLVLAGIYAVSVVGIGSALRSFGGGGGGDLVVAASTLVVAAAFVPLRRRVQSLVDRRFDRANYDAQRIVEEFGLRLRDEVELGALSDDLRAVVAATVHPDQVGLWVAPEQRP